MSESKKYPRSSITAINIDRLSPKPPFGIEDDKNSKVVKLSAGAKITASKKKQ